MKLKVVVTLGTRPEAIKLFPVIHELRKRKHDVYIIWTGQHYDKNMSFDFYKQLNIMPDFTYNNISDFKENSEKIYARLKEEGYTISLVQGDTNSVLYGAEISKKLGFKVAHIEAGLRSFDMTMPEEVNRIMVDAISDYLFCPSLLASLNANARTMQQDYVVGNTIVDSLEYYLSKMNKTKTKRITVTMHRPSNVDNKQTLVKQLNNISKFGYLNTDLTIMLFLHPRTRKMIEQFDISIPSNINIFDPISDYQEMLESLYKSEYVITDSGGIQEECCILGVPCVVMRENTERPETLQVGSAALVGTDWNKFKDAFFKFKNSTGRWINPFGKNVSKQIVDMLEGRREVSK